MLRQDPLQRHQHRATGRRQHRQSERTSARRHARPGMTFHPPRARDARCSPCDAPEPRLQAPGHARPRLPARRHRPQRLGGPGRFQVAQRGLGQLAPQRWQLSRQGASQHQDHRGTTSSARNALGTTLAADTALGARHHREPRPRWLATRSPSSPSRWLLVAPVLRQHAFAQRGRETRRPWTSTNGKAGDGRTLVARKDPLQRHHQRAGGRRQRRQSERTSAGCHARPGTTSPCTARARRSMLARIREDSCNAFTVRRTTGVKLRGPEGAQRPRATPASTSELDRNSRSTLRNHKLPILRRTRRSRAFEESQVIVCAQSGEKP